MKKDLPAAVSALPGAAEGPPPMGAPDKGYAPLDEAPGAYVLEP